MMSTTDDSGHLPADVRQAIAVTNAASIGEQPALLANIALANQIFTTHLAQQQAVAAQHAISVLRLAALAKGVEFLMRIDPADPQALDRVTAALQLFESQLTRTTHQSASGGGAMSESTGNEGAAQGTASVAASTGLPASITEGIAAASVSSVGEQPAILANISLGNLIQNTNLSQQNAVSFQQTLNSIQATVLGKAVNMLTTLGPLEAMSAQQLLTGNAVAEEIGDLKAALATSDGKQE